MIKRILSLKAGKEPKLFGKLIHPFPEIETAILMSLTMESPNSIVSVMHT